MKALIYLGRDLKKEKYLKYNEGLNDINFEWIDLISLSSRRFDIFSVKNGEQFFTFCKKLNKDEVIVCDLHKSSFDDIQIYIIKREDISNILPAILCTSFKIEEKSFIKWNYEQFKSEMWEILKTKSLVIEIKNQEITMYSVLSSTLVIKECENINYEIYKPCQVQGWLWRPTRLLATISNKINIKQILSMNLIENVKYAKLKIIWNISKLSLDINSLIKKFQYADLCLVLYPQPYFYKEHYFELWFSGSFLTLIIGGYFFRFSNYNPKELKIIGWDVIMNENDSIFALEISKLHNIKSDKILVQKNNDYPINNEFLTKIKNLSVSKNKVYALVEKSNLTLRFDLRNLNREYMYFENCSKIVIELNYTLKLEEVIKKINLLPKNTEYIFELKDLDI